MVTPYVYTNQEAAQLLSLLGEERARTRGTDLQWPETMPTLQKYAPPIYRGQTHVVCAATGEGKSTYGKWWLRQNVKHLAINGRANKCLYVALEETVEGASAAIGTERLSYKEISAGIHDKEELEYKLAVNANDKVCFIGRSVNGAAINPKAASFKRPSSEDIGDAAYKIAKSMTHGWEACVLDYLQLLDEGDDNTTKNTSLASKSWLDVVSKTLNCPTVVLTQSRVDPKTRENKIPNVYDAQHSSAIGQDCYIHWGWWRPSKDYPLGHMIKVSQLGKEYLIPVFSDMVIVKVNKWRDGDDIDGMIFVLGSSYKGVRGELYELNLEWLNSISKESANAYIRMGKRNLYEFQPWSLT